jgi:hypothetical protein
LGVPTGTIAGIVINLPPASRHSWIATMELSVDELETDTERKIAKQGRADQVRDQEQLRGEIEAMSEPRVQNDKFGYPVD